MAIWAAKWISKSPDYMPHFIRSRGVPALFQTRKKCRAWIKLHCGYIKYRKDLKTYPHFWRMPQAVKVDVKERKV